jgi:hypothetical protein
MAPRYTGVGQDFAVAVAAYLDGVAKDDPANGSTGLPDFYDRRLRHQSLIRALGPA